MRAKAAGAQALYLPLYGPGLISAIRQARDLKFSGHLLTADSYGDSDVRRTGSAAEGVFATQIWFDQDGFRRRYAAAFGNPDGSSGVSLGYVALAYDAVLMLESLRRELAARGLPLSREGIVVNLPGFAFKGILGDARISKERMTDRREKVLVVKDGKFKLRWSVGE